MLLSPIEKPAASIRQKKKEQNKILRMSVHSTPSRAAITGEMLLRAVIANSGVVAGNLAMRALRIKKRKAEVPGKGRLTKEPKTSKPETTVKMTERTPKIMVIGVFLTLARRRRQKIAVIKKETALIPKENRSTGALSAKGTEMMSSSMDNG